ncbi:MAG TPA: CAP domain-containing protein [Thermoanaerobaculia bacterium]|nr:CAP domain-containing protein [Thermoanaerobaculia bacterium]
MFIVSLATPVSLIAETRRLSETDLRRMARELTAIVGTGGVSVERGDGSSTRQPAPARTSSGNRDIVRTSNNASDSQAIVDEMNRYRRHGGQPPLRLNERLSLAAGDRVDDMFTKGYFNHVAPDGLQPFIWLPRRGYRYAAAGENLASGYQSAEALVRGWMSSPSHRANILGNYEEVGLASASAAPVRRMSGPLIVAMYATER